MGRLFIVAGERRWQAAGQAGLTTLPAIFAEGNHAEIALVENLQRQALIDIARKKQERGMITAYNAFRLKQQKAGEAGEKVCTALIAVKDKIDIFITPNPVPARS